MENIIVNPIAAALEQLRPEIIERAEKACRIVIDYIENHLRENDWDIAKTAPYPSNVWDRRKYRSMEKNYYLYHSIVSADAARNSMMPGAPFYVQMDQAKIARFIESHVRDAVASFESYVAKMISKIGECAEATLQYERGLWGYSVLEITRADGTTERWKTQLIHNTSGLGTPYVQFPTRKMK